MKILFFLLWSPEQNRYLFILRLWTFIHLIFYLMFPKKISYDTEIVDDKYRWRDIMPIYSSIAKRLDKIPTRYGLINLGFLILWTTLPSSSAALCRPSNAILTMSNTPPVGFVSNPMIPLPTPLKKPSTPSSCAPRIKIFSLEQTCFKINDYSNA